MSGIERQGRTGDTPLRAVIITEYSLSHTKKGQPTEKTFPSSIYTDHFHGCAVGLHLSFCILLWEYLTTSAYL